MKTKNMQFAFRKTEHATRKFYKATSHDTEIVTRRYPVLVLHKRNDVPRDALPRC